jgi:ubiquitin-conjugating enzyme E2 Z
LREQREVKDGTQFERMPFESTANGMHGKFDYHDLEKRLCIIRKTLDEESRVWIEDGLKASQNHETIASNLNHQFQQCQAHFEQDRKGVTVTLEMEKDNPFVWTMVPYPSLHR